MFSLKSFIKPHRSMFINSIEKNPRLNNILFNNKMLIYKAFGINREWDRVPHAMLVNKELIKQEQASQAITISTFLEKNKVRGILSKEQVSQIESLGYSLRNFSGHCFLVYEKGGNLFILVKISSKKPFDYLVNGVVVKGYPSKINEEQLQWHKKECGEAGLKLLDNKYFDE